MAFLIFRDLYNLLPYVHGDKIYTAYNLFDTGRVHYAEKSPDTFLKVENDKDRAKKNFLEGLILLAGTAPLINVLDNTFKILPINYNEFSEFAVTVGLSIVATLVGILAVKIFNKFITCTKKNAQDLITAQGQQTEVKARWDRPFRYNFQQFSYVLRITAAIGMAILSTSPLYHSINALVLIYNLIKISKWEWLTVSREFDRPVGGGLKHYVTKVVAEYYFRLFKTNSNERANCTVCLEGEKKEEENAEFYFCNKHRFHPHCIGGLLETNSRVIIQGAELKRSEGFRDGKHYVDYSADVPNENRVFCPNCRQQPFKSEVELIVHENNSWQRVSPKFVDRLPERA